MKALDRIEDMLCDEIETIGKKNELTHDSLDILDVAVDIIKDIHTINAMDQEYPSDNGYSQGYYGRMPIYMYDNGMPGNSYARGNNAPRDTSGRYMSRGYSGDTKDELHRLMDTAKDDREREAIKNALDHMR